MTPTPPMTATRKRKKAREWGEVRHMMGTTPMSVCHERDKYVCHQYEHVRVIVREVKRGVGRKRA